MTEEDCGPFADMDPDLRRAITRYGTEPVRKVVQVSVRSVRDWSFDEMPDSIDGWIAWLNAARSEVPLEYRDDLKCVLQYEPGSRDEGDRSELAVWYERPETDDEMRERVGRGIAYVRSEQLAERRAYEALKAKFG